MQPTAWHHRWHATDAIRPALDGPQRAAGARPSRTCRFAQRAVRRFMPGERVEDAFAAAERLRDERIGVLFTRLGENLTTLDEAEAVAEHYRAVLAPGCRTPAPGRPGRDCRSSPPSWASTRTPTPAWRICHDIARRCAEAGTWFWIDMEGSALHRPHHGPGRGPHGRARQRRHRPAGLSEAHVPPMSSACCPSSPPSAWSRAPTTSRPPSPTAMRPRSTPTSWVWR